MCGSITRGGDEQWKYFDHGLFFRHWTPGCPGFAGAGWRVFASARQPADVTRLQADGLESLVLDLRDSVSIHAAVTAVLERTGGRLDALFNNGAYGQPGAVEDLSREALREQFETNLFGTLELTNRLILVMRQQGGDGFCSTVRCSGWWRFPSLGALMSPASSRWKVWPIPYGWN